jgi:hypothetical protein
MFSLTSSYTRNLCKQLHKNLTFFSQMLSCCYAIKFKYLKILDSCRRRTRWHTNCFYFKQPLGFYELPHGFKFL